MKKYNSLFLLFLVVSMILCSCSNSERIENCSFCGAENPEKYGIWDFYGNKVCTDCAQNQINDHIQNQENMKSDIKYNGEYIPDIDYFEDYLVVKKSECNWCGNYAPSDLYDKNGERICIDCITEALQNDKVARAIQNYVENG